MKNRKRKRKKKKKKKKIIRPLMKGPKRGVLTSVGACLTRVSTRTKKEVINPIVRNHVTVNPW
jgi:hypothetical protein